MIPYKRTIKCLLEGLFVVGSIVFYCYTVQYFVDSWSAYDIEHHVVGDFNYPLITKYMVVGICAGVIEILCGMLLYLIYNQVLIPFFEELKFAYSEDSIQRAAIKSEQANKVKQDGELSHIKSSKESNSQ